MLFSLKNLFKDESNLYILFLVHPSTLYRKPFSFCFKNWNSLPANFIHFVKIVYWMGFLVYLVFTFKIYNHINLYPYKITKSDNSFQMNFKWKYVICFILWCNIWNNIMLRNNVEAMKAKGKVQMLLLSLFIYKK